MNPLLLPLSPFHFMSLSEPLKPPISFLSFYAFFHPLTQPTPHSFAALLCLPKGSGFPVWSHFFISVFKLAQNPVIIGSKVNLFCHLDSWNLAISAQDPKFPGFWFSTLNELDSVFRFSMWFPPRIRKGMELDSQADQNGAFFVSAECQARVNEVGQFYLQDTIQNKHCQPARKIRTEITNSNEKVKTFWKN